MCMTMCHKTELVAEIEPLKTHEEQNVSLKNKKQKKD